MEQHRLREPGSGASVLDHVVVSYGGYGTKPAVEVKASSPRITNSTFRKNKNDAIKMTEGGGPEIANNSFFNNGWGINYYGPGFALRARDCDSAATMSIGESAA